MGVQSERILTPAQFATVSTLAKSIAGLDISAQKTAMVQARLGKRVRELGFADLQVYCNFISGANSGNEIDEFISILTTNVTSFNREPHHFDHFREYIAPRIELNARRGDVSRVWSAGCSEGMELLSAAMEIIEAYPDIDTRRLKLLGTDIDQKVIRRAQQHQYSSAVDGQIKRELINKYFEKGANGYAVKPRLTKMTTFNILNLIEEWPFTHKFDAIFCRNVVIYFDEETRIRLWPRFAKLLSPGGTLYIGHSERITGPAESLFDLVGTTTYTLK